MKISYDREKRARTLVERGLDFDDAARLFSDAPVVDYVDDRRDYGEVRWISSGYLDGRLLVIVWTQRGDTRHVISMRKANEREQAKFGR